MQEMESIQIEELEKLDADKMVVADIRPREEYDRGTWPGAVSLPMDEFEKKAEELPKDKTIYVLCHTGERSQEYTERLLEMVANPAKRTPRKDVVETIIHEQHSIAQL